MRVPGGSVVRWNFNSCAVHAIHEGRASLCVAFDRIMTEPGWDKHTTAKSGALKHKLEDFDFSFLLRVFRSIFGARPVMARMNTCTCQLCCLQPLVLGCCVVV